MVALLAVEKKRLIAANGHVTLCDFRAAWEICWEVMVLERAWAHNTPIRRSSRASLVATKSEMRASFLEVETPFAYAASELAVAANGMCLELDVQQIPPALLAAITYVEIADRQELLAA